MVIDIVWVSNQKYEMLQKIPNNYQYNYTYVSFCTVIMSS